MAMNLCITYTEVVVVVGGWILYRQMSSYRSIPWKQWTSAPCGASVHYLGLSVKISSCKHLQKIFENWLVMRKSISRQQSLSFIDYIYLNKSKSYAGHMQAKLKQRKIILENFAALIVFFPQAKRDNPSKSATNQRLKLKCSVAFAL